MKILFLIYLISINSYAQNSNTWNIELFTGDAYNLPSKVTVRQNGYEEASKTAKWSTRPMEPAPYYSLRLSYWEDGKSIELEMLHHKIHMENTDEIFNQYDSTFGFNFFLLNRGWNIYQGVILRLGLGPVVSHPVNTIRGQRYSSDVVYNIVGFGGQGAIQFKQDINEDIYFTQEFKLTYGNAEIPIENGTSFVSNTAFHGLVGLGMNF